MQSRLTIGDTLNFTTEVVDYPANDGWTLKYRLVLRVVGTAITLTGMQDTVDPSLHRIQATATLTATWTPGVYSWTSWVEKTGQVYSVSSGTVQLMPDPRTATTNYDGRTEAQLALDQAKAALAAWTPTTKSYSIGGRQMEFNSIEEIIKVVS